jgi:hypothetical protein
MKLRKKEDRKWKRRKLNELHMNVIANSLLFTPASSHLKFQTKTLLTGVVMRTFGMKKRSTEEPSQS